MSFIDIDEEFKSEKLNEFYIYSAEKREEKSKILKEIIRERYQLEENSIEENLDSEIVNIIYSDEESTLARELEKMFRNNEDFLKKSISLRKIKTVKNQFYLISFTIYHNIMLNY
jgi:hypothetical protein